MDRKNRIAEALEVRGKRQIELAKVTGKGRSVISSYVANRWQPKPQALLAMAKFLDVSELWLAGYDAPMERTIEQKKADELAMLIHRLRKDEKFKDLVNSIATLTDTQFSIIESTVAEFLKTHE